MFIYSLYYFSQMTMFFYKNTIYKWGINSLALLDVRHGVGNHGAWLFMPGSMSIPSACFDILTVMLYNAILC